MQIRTVRLFIEDSMWMWLSVRGLSMCLGQFGRPDGVLGVVVKRNLADRIVAMCYLNVQFALVELHSDCCPCAHSHMNWHLASV